MFRKSNLLLGCVLLGLCCFACAGLAEAASNESVISGGVGLTTVDEPLKRLVRGILAVVKPIVVIMTAISGVMVTLNIGGDHKRQIWNLILGLGLAMNFGSVLGEMWNAPPPATGVQEAIEYSVKVKDETNPDVVSFDILTPFMRYYLTIIVSGALQIQPIAIKLLLFLALADMSIRLALDLTEKDKVSWMAKTILRIGFYVFLIQHWLGTDGLNLMDTLSKGFQEIGFMAAGYGQALPTSVSPDALASLDPKDNLAPDSIVNNGYKMFIRIYSAVLNSISVFSPAKSLIVVLCSILPLLIAIFCIFMTGVEMFMARIEFYTLALLGMPLLAFGVVKHFEYLAQNTIRAVFNCGVKVCVIAFLQAVLCQLFTKYASEIETTVKAESTLSNYGALISLCVQFSLMSIIMYLIVRSVPKVIQGLLSGNPSMSGSDMTGTAMNVAGSVAAGAGIVAGAKGAAQQLASGTGSSPGNMKMSEMPIPKGIGSGDAGGGSEATAPSDTASGSVGAPADGGAAPSVGNGSQSGASPSPDGAPVGGGSKEAASASGSKPKSAASIIGNELLRRTPGIGRVISSYEDARDGVYRHQGIDTKRNNNQKDDSSPYRQDPSTIPPTINTKDDDDEDEKKDKKS